MTPRFSSEARVLAAFFAAVVVVVGLTGATWKMANDAVEAERWVLHTHEVLDSLVRTRADTLQVELSTQNFRLTGDPSRLVERDATIAMREALLDRIKQLTRDNAGQQERWRQLREVIDQRLAISRRVEALRKTQGPEAASAFAATAPLAQTRARTYRLLDEMDAMERQLLADRRAAQMQSRELLVAIGALVACLLASMLAATYVLIRRQLRETEASRRALAASEDSLATTLHSIGDGVLATDTAGCITRMNRVAERLTGWSLDEARGKPIDEVFRIVHEQSRAPAEVPVAKVLATGEIHGLANHTVLIARHGGECPIADSAAPIRDVQGRVSGVVLVFRDVTLEKQHQETIRRQNEWLEQRVEERTLELTNLGRALKTLSAGNRTMLRATREQELLDNMCRVIVKEGGYRMASVWYRLHDASSTLRPMAESGHPGGLAALQRMPASWADNPHGRGALARAIRGAESCVVRDISHDPSYEPWRTHLPGCVDVLACPLRVGGEIIGGLAIYAAQAHAFGADEVNLLTESADDLAFGIATLRARAEQLEIQAAMHRLTRHDALTGLPNEAQFTDLLTAAIERGKHGPRPFAVLQTNIERLSEINDALGFSHGDEMLRQFGARLRAAVPEPAIVARLRGDEFAILLPDTDVHAAVNMVRRLEQALAAPFPIADIPLDVLVKTGVVLFPDHGATPHDLYRHVDIALRWAKKTGAGHAIFDPTLSRERPHRLNMAGELRRAIEGGDLLLYLQPKVQFISGRVCGAEGLVRWRHAERGLIAPGEFIELAEQTGLIKPLTEWVIETGLRLNQTWAREGCALPIAINLSARNLRDEDLLKQIRSMQAKWGVAPGLLELEVTETAVMEDAEFALRVLHLLHDDGIALYIDDFGTGYSSLSYLQKLPVDYIKIDQSFVRDLSTRKDSAVIVRSTIDLVRDLGRKTVAEGVETQQEWTQLADMGCDIVQGYFIARPMPSDELPAWIEQFHASGRIAMGPPGR